MKIKEITPDRLKEVDDKELLNLHRRCHQLYPQIKEEGGEEINLEDLVNAHHLIVAEMQRRGMEHNEHDELDKELREKAKTPLNFDKLPDEIVVTPDFVSVVGSSVKRDDYNDVDILVRSDLKDGKYHIQYENIYLPLRKAITPRKEATIHIINNPQGPHDDYIPLYDLVLRKKSTSRIEELKKKLTNKIKSIISRLKGKEQQVVIELGCGKNKHKGAICIDKNKECKPDILHDLEDGIPFDDNSVDKVLAFHVLEHLSDKEKIMSEIHRVLKPGGLFIFEVPSAEGPGAFAHPDHKSFWVKESFYFWANDELRENRPKFEIVELEETTKGKLKYVRGILKKPLSKALQPVTYDFTPQKPAMKLYNAGTEAFKPEELEAWLKKHPNSVAEVKLNGFRAILQKRGGKVSLRFEDSEGEKVDKIQGLEQALKKIDTDFILDCDVGIVEGGKRWPRTKLMTLTAKKPEIPPGAHPIITLFDALYIEDAGGDIHEKPFRERRKALEELYSKYFKDLKVGGAKIFDITEQVPVKSMEDLKKAWNKYSKVYLSEGIVVKDLEAPYNLKGGTDALAKVKLAAELKVIVLETRKNKNGSYSFRCGLLPGSLKFKNTTEFQGKEYVDLKWSMNANFKAEPGDILTVWVGEIIIKQEKDGEVLAWAIGMPQDIDKSRKEPYTAGQAIDIAKRSGVLQDTRESIDDTTAQKLLKCDWKPNKDKLDFLKSYDPVTKEMKLYKRLYSKLYDVEGGHQLVKMYYDLYGPEGIKELLKDEDSEGETRGEAAAKYWAENWWKNFPKSGKGKFVAQHHWRGLSKEETKLSNEELLETDHSVHADLRFTANDHLWGFSVFLGETKENKEAGGSLLYKLGERKLQGSFKLPQPKEWLKVGVDEPYISEPGGVGSTSRKYSKFFAIDHGTYEIGVWREHMFEVFLRGKKLKGRYIIEYAPVGGQRIWLIEKPKDQTPYAEKNRLEDVIKELKKKGQKYLIWAKPGQKPRLIEVDKFEVEKRAKTNDKKFVAPIVKVDEEKRFALAPALVPDKVDKDGEFITAEEIEETAHDFMAWYQMVTYMHEIPIEKKDIAIVESYILRQPLKAGGVELPEGTWMLGFKIYDDSLWEEVKKGKIKGISIGGYCMGCNPKPKFAIEKSQKKTKESGDDEEPRELKNLKVFEVALVDNPAVPDAQWLILKRDKDEVRNVPEKKEKQATGGVDALKLLQEAMKLIEQAMAQVESAVMGYAYAPPEKKGAKKEEKQGGKALEDALKEIVESEDAPKEVKEAAKKILEFLRGGDAYPAPKKEEEEEKATEAKEEKQPKAPEKTEKQEKPKPKENLDKIVTKQIEKAMKKLDKKIGKIREEIEEVEKKFLATGETQKLKETTREEGAEDFYAKIGRDPFGRRLKKQ